MSDSGLSIPPIVAVTQSGGVQLVRLPVERPQMAVDFLHARSEGVMDLIAHFWERLSQTPPLSRGDLHLVAALPATRHDDEIINISTLDISALTGAMLYVPKAHRADVLALDAATAGAFAAYISHHGPKAIKSDNVGGRVEIGEVIVGDPANINGSATENEAIAITAADKAITSILLSLTDLSGTVKGAGSATEFPSEVASAKSGGANGKIPIDFLTGHADGIGWMTPLLLPAVNRRAPARQMTNVVMQLSSEVTCDADPAVRVAREADLPVLNRWRRQYKEERGILFDADLDAWVQTQKVFVYEHEKQVVAVAKFDLELPRVIEIGGVYTFPEFRTRGFGAKIVSDLACRIRQAGRVPTLQVDEQNLQAMRLYEGLGWKPRGKLARVWLTG